MIQKTKGVSLIIILFVGVLGFISYFYLSQSRVNKNTAITELKRLVNLPNPTPTPFPFQDLTIPYLRSREYKSELGELEKVSENANYTSYFTSYDSEGFRVNGLLTIPKGAPSTSSGWPAVIFVHGYILPEEYQTFVNYNSYVDYLAKNGLVVFKIDLRGHDESEGEAGGAYYSGDYVIDSLNAVTALKNEDFVDPNRISLWGHSMAGNVVFRSFIAMPEIKKVVIWAGAGYTYTDLQEFRISDNSYRPPPVNTERARKRQELRNLYGDFNSESEFWKQVPATNYLVGVSGKFKSITQRMIMW